MDVCKGVDHDIGGEIIPLEYVSQSVPSHLSKCALQNDSYYIEGQVKNFLHKIFGNLPFFLVFGNLPFQFTKILIYYYFRLLLSKNLVLRPLSSFSIKAPNQFITPKTTSFLVSTILKSRIQPVPSTFTNINLISSKD